jgi:hypothetical protein
VGVEPTLPFGKPDFESGAFGHSAISPIGRQTYAAYATEGQAPEEAVGRRSKAAGFRFATIWLANINNLDFSFILFRVGLQTRI